MLEDLISIHLARKDTFCIKTGRAGVPAFSYWERDFHTPQWKTLGESRMPGEPRKAVLEGCSPELRRGSPPLSFPGQDAPPGAIGSWCDCLGDPGWTTELLPVQVKSREGEGRRGGTEAQTDGLGHQLSWPNAFPSPALRQVRK